MTDTLLIVSIILSAASLIMATALLLRKPEKREDFSTLFSALDAETRVAEANSRALREKIEDLERRIADLTKNIDYNLGETRRSVNENLKYMYAENEKNLKEIREVVGEKLEATLEKRLTVSFDAVLNQLEAVYKGVGEVRKVAEGVSDIKKVFSNVKSRGNWGESQLNALLSQTLSPEQYEKNFKIDEMTDERVDFAVVLPGKDEKLYLPIDSKFPTEEYARLSEAYESGDLNAIEKSGKAFSTRLKDEAKSISSKYIKPPKTTDFAIMYLPSEALYAEALRREEVSDYMRQTRIVLSGPTNLSALLSSLQTGFKTLAIEKRSSELWRLLSSVKTEFMRFSELLTKTQKKLQEAQDAIDLASKKTRTIGRKLGDVKEIESESEDESSSH